ncbi:MAG: A/G-specific adenine glycosylase [Candidatus Omnitrophica bacterium]|nr:A/G-specific adenine glycosylase [Candidatus Omnitrophota bacterium]
MPKKSSFSQEILSWYRANKRSLPWRETKDPYKIWVSEIMLQQTTVKAVIDYYRRWIVRFPTVESLAQASLDDVLKNWQGLGYYNRAKNLHKAAQMVVQEFKGVLPKDPQVVRKIPGFGPYTVGAVLSIAYDIKLPIIDANVRRVFMRQLGIQGLADTSQDKAILVHLLKIMPDQHIGDFNQALMELGALICRSKEPVCNICPVNKHCKAYEQDIQELIPAPKKVEIKDIKAVVGIVQDLKGRYLIQQRPSKGLLANLWEFPGGKIEKTDKTPQEALKREFKEELQCDALVGNRICEVSHYYTQFKVKLTAFEVKLQGSLGPGKYIWVSPKDLQGKYAMPSGSAKIVEVLIKTRHS